MNPHFLHCRQFLYFWAIGPLEKPLDLDNLCDFYESLLFFFSPFCIPKRISYKYHSNVTFKNCITFSLWRECSCFIICVSFFTSSFQIFQTYVTLLPFLAVSFRDEKYLSHSLLKFFSVRILSQETIQEILMQCFFLNLICFRIAHLLINYF